MPGFIATAANVGRRLDVVLAEQARFSRAAAQRLIAANRVTIAGVPAAQKHHLRAGDEVMWTPLPVEKSGLTAEQLDLHIVYEDEWLLVVDKPAGMVTHPAPGHEHGTLVHGLLDHGISGGHGSRPGVVHRLDKDTSGLLIVARGDAAYQALVAAMAQRQIKRTYIALLSGRLPQDEGAIDAPIGRHLRDRRRMSLHSAKPRRAVTHFTVLDRVPDYTLARVQLETGRTHQIRVHMAAIGYPVAGDVQYGCKHRPARLERQFLHASRLAFAHPVDGRQLDFVSPLPPDLAAFLADHGLTLPPF
ncbi:MAG: RluA family pseudouridine synthase [Thermoleophilia bacterium]